jgi:hypothetical protein
MGSDRRTPCRSNAKVIIPLLCVSCKDASKQSCKIDSLTVRKADGIVQNVNPQDRVKRVQGMYDPICTADKWAPAGAL